MSRDDRFSSPMRVIVGGQEDKKFEITILMPNGDWKYWREECRDFQAACESGIASAKRNRGARLIRVERVS